MIGTKLAHYEITSRLGSGGMGDVYQASDSKLGRSVAIKLLPEAFSHDKDWAARFEREARVLASLNHPHIAAIYGIEEANQRKFLVMELVPGQTLAERIKRGPLPIDEALLIAKQIAEALEAAHDKGIIHRDLKPANIKVRDDDTVKVLDFGLAKSIELTGASSSASQSPTISTPAMSQAGIIMGTAAYMSPEQAKGKPVDKRSDVWAFACVLYEMLTGRRAFEGEDVSDTIAAVLRGEPDWAALPADIPPHVRAVIRRGLEKDRKARIPDLSVARFMMDDAGVAAPAIPHARPSRSRLLLPWLITAAAVMALIALLPAWRSRPSLPTTRLLIDIGAEASIVIDQGATFALSADGRVLTFVAQPAAGPAQLYVRRLEQLNATPLPGTSGARYPFFSPDGEWIAFFADGMLKKIPVGGGAVKPLCAVPSGRGGSWSPDGTIIFAPAARGASPLQRVNAAGGVSEPVTQSVQGELVQRFPQVLPGGRAVLYHVTVRPADYETAKVVVQPLPSGERRVLRDGGYFPRYLPSGHLLYIHGGTLFAQLFDVDRLQVSGNPVPIMDNIQIANEGSALYAVSESGTLAYLPDRIPQSSSAPLLWMDRAGRTTTLRTTATQWANPRFSPDGRRLAMDITANGNTDIWVYDLERDQMLKLTSDPAEERRPVWTPDGSRIVFASRRPGGDSFELYWQRADASGKAERLLEGSVSRVPGSWDPKGKKILAFTETGPGAAENLMTVTIDGDERTGWKVGTPQPFLTTPGFRKFQPMFSPDGRWIAYHSDMAGTTEVFVRSFPDSGRQYTVSTTGGQNPVWSLKSQELFYTRRSSSSEDVGGELYAVSYRVEGESLVFDRPRVIGKMQSGQRLAQHNYDGHPDGKRFVVAPVEPAPSATAQRSIVFVFNFLDEIRRLVPRQ